MNSDQDLKPITGSRLKIIKSIIDDFDGTTPFHHFLKSVFRKNKSFGSSDRRIYRSWCYAWFRLGHAMPNAEFDARLFVAYFLVNGIDDKISEELATYYLDEADVNSKTSNVDDRIKIVKGKFPEFDTTKITDHLPDLSGSLTADDFARSMLIQPDVFMRVIEGKMKIVQEELKKRQVNFTVSEESKNCLILDAGVNLSLLEFDKNRYFEIQDINSQRIANLIPARENEKWWDCCCGAGGKSLALTDRVENLKLLATDKRDSVLKNFKSRLNFPKNRNVEIEAIDLELPLPDKFHNRKFSGIIADVPCTGSGTWSRTPENIVRFSPDALNTYTLKQKGILAAVAPTLSSGGILFYSTCSVFKGENEDIIKWAEQNLDYELIDYQLLTGVNNRADSMFYAVLKKR